MNMESNAVPDSPLDAQAVAPAALAPTRPLYWSVRRELWENRSIYIAPLAVGAVYLVGFLISLYWLPRSVRALISSHRLATLNPAQADPYPARHAVRPRRDAAHLCRVSGRDLLLARRAAQRASRSQHPVLEVAAGFGSYDCALEGGHSARDSAGARFGRHRFLCRS